MAASATSTRVSGIARTRFRNGRCHAFCSISASTSSPSRNRISDQRDHRQPLNEVRRRVEVEHLEAALAEHEAGDHERRRERQEAAPGEPRQQRAHHQQAAEDGDRLLQELDPGSDERHAQGSYLGGA